MWALAVLLTTASAEPPQIFPLAVGHTWTYTLRERKGSGTRFLFMTSKPATNIKLADWTFTIAEDKGDHFIATLTSVPTEGLTTVAQMKLWERDGLVYTDGGGGERLAIEASVPPGAVSSERIRCVAHVLGGVVGSCAPHPGGPLAVTPGLIDGVAGADVKQGAGLAQVLIGIATVGTIIPGNQSRVERVTLTGFTAGEGAEIVATPSALVAEVKKGSKSPSQIGRFVAQNPPDPESAAAVLTLVSDIDGAMVQLLPALSAEDRHPVVRTAIQRSRKPMVTLAKASEFLEDEPAEPQMLALLAPFGSDMERERATRVIAGQDPLYVAMIVADGTFDDDRNEVLARELPKHPVTIEQAVPVLSLFSFDAGRADAVALLLAQVPEEQHGEALLAWIPTLSFDSAKIKMMTAHVDTLKALPESDRQLLVDDSAFKEDEVRALLGL